MFVNTYDIENIQFGIVAMEITEKENEYLKEPNGLQRFIHNHKSWGIIPYSELIGVEMEIASRIVAGKTIVLNSFYQVSNTQYNNFFLIEKDLYKDEYTLDSVIASIFLSKYSSYNSRAKRIARCFLQRYMFKTKEETDKALREYAGVEDFDNHGDLKELMKKPERKTDN